MPYGGGPVQRDMGAGLGATEATTMIETIPLKELVSISKGKKPKELIDEEMDGFHPYLTAAQLLHGDVKQWAQGGIDAFTSDVLVSWDGTVGNVGWGITGIVGSTIGIISPNLERVDVAFLGRFLSTKKRLLNDTATGATIKHIRRSVLENLQFPSIPLSEQRRIAAIIDKTDEIKQTINDKNNRKIKLIESCFVDIFGNPATNPKGWKTVSLGSVLQSKPTNGLYKSKEFIGSGSLYLTNRSLFRGLYVDLEETRRVEINDVELQKYSVNNGDLMINRVSVSPEGVGKVSLVKGLKENCVYESNIMRMRIDTSSVLQSYITVYLNTGFMREIIKSMSNIGNQASINQKAVNSIPITLPPLNLQERFEETIDTINNLFQESISEIESVNSIIDSVENELLG